MAEPVVHHDHDRIEATRLTCVLSGWWLDRESEAVAGSVPAVVVCECKRTRPIALDSRSGDADSGTWT